MNCREIFIENNYSLSIIKQAFHDDAGSWWWWINILGTLVFGLIGCLGNLICLMIVCRYSLSKHSFVEYLRFLSLFDLFTLFYECYQSLNDMSLYLFSRNVLNFRFSLLCKLYDYSKHSVILLSCWTIVALTIDRFILVCQPFIKRWPNLSRRLCTRHSAKCIIFSLIALSLLINIPHLIVKEWLCELRQFRFSTNATHPRTNETCSCRVSPSLNPQQMKSFIFWHNFIFHLLFYTVTPAVILIASNAAILKRIHAPREIISQQNEHLRSRLTVTLTLVSLMFLSLYAPYAVVQTISYLILTSPRYHCNIHLILRLHQLKRLSELLNIAALGMNFFVYILGVRNYRSSAIRMLHLHNYQCFRKYLTSENSTVEIIQRQIHRSQNPTCSGSFKLLQVTQSAHGPVSSSISNVHHFLTETH